MYFGFNAVEKSGNFLNVYFLKGLDQIQLAWRIVMKRILRFQDLPALTMRILMILNMIVMGIWTCPDMQEMIGFDVLFFWLHNHLIGLFVELILR